MRIWKLTEKSCGNNGLNKEFEVIPCPESFPPPQLDYHCPRTSPTHIQALKEEQRAYKLTLTGALA